MPDPITLKVAAEAVAKTAEIVKLLGEITTRIADVPKQQARHLAAAHGEVSKDQQALLAEVAQYRRLSFAGEFKQIAPAVLAGLEGPAALVRVKNAGGSCQLIWNLYHQHLKAWFQHLLAPRDYAITEQIFAELGDADDRLFATMEQACVFLSGEARDVADRCARNTGERPWRGPRRAGRRFATSRRRWLAPPAH